MPPLHRGWCLCLGVENAQARRPLGHTRQDGAMAMMATEWRMVKRVCLEFPATRRHLHEDTIPELVGDNNVLRVVEGLKDAGLRNLPDSIWIHVNSKSRHTQCVHSTAVPRWIFGLNLIRLNPCRTLSILQRIAQKLRKRYKRHETLLVPIEIKPQQT